MMTVKFLIKEHLRHWADLARKFRRRLHTRTSRTLQKASPATLNVLLTTRLPKLPERLQWLEAHELQRFIPAEPLPANSSRPDFFRLTPRQPDGWWVCRHCTHRNSLVVLPCRHPLGYLVCKECKRPWDPMSPTTDTMRFFTSPIDSNQIGPYAANTEQMYLAYVCKNCGLTWRAKARDVGGRWVFGFPKKRCVCGEIMVDGMGRDWERERFGSNWQVFALPECKTEDLWMNFGLR